VETVRGGVGERVALRGEEDSHRKIGLPSKENVMSQKGEERVCIKKTSATLVGTQVKIMLMKNGGSCIKATFWLKKRGGKLTKPQGKRAEGKGKSGGESCWQKKTTQKRGKI